MSVMRARYAPKAGMNPAAALMPDPGPEAPGGGALRESAQLVNRPVKAQQTMIAAQW